MKGYKVFNKDWTCRGFQYKVGESYEMPEKGLKICGKGFHFCKELFDCFNYYDVNPFEVRIAEVEVYGKILYQEEGTNSKCCTNKIRIIREISFPEALDMINQSEHPMNWNFNENYGKSNYGVDNYDNFNHGLLNFGTNNAGLENFGSVNFGIKNIGQNNEGYFNVGDTNIGEINLGKINLAFLIAEKIILDFGIEEITSWEFFVLSPHILLYSINLRQ